MTYIWANYSEKKRFQIASSGISPYLEVWDSQSNPVLVNIRFGLDEILLDEADFPQSLQPDQDGGSFERPQLGRRYEEDERYKDFANIFIHYIAQNQLRRGFTLQNLAAFKIGSEIEKGLFGENIKNNFSNLKFRDQLILTRYIALYDLRKQREIQFDAALAALFDDVKMYYDNQTEKLFVFVDKESNDYNKNLFGLVCYFLKDVEVEVEVLWKGEMFGIIGLDDEFVFETIIIDKTALI